MHKILIIIIKIKALNFYDHKLYILMKKKKEKLILYMYTHM